jgi:integrase
MSISNELSLLRRILRVALREGYKVSVPSFEDLIVRMERHGREITEEEQAKLLPVFAPWMGRIWAFGRETCLSLGDLLRLTHDMINERQGTITPEGGRKKTKVAQVSPLTDRAREILDEIKAAKKSGAIVSNLNGLVFTLNDGTRIPRASFMCRLRSDQSHGRQEICIPQPPEYRAD